MITLSDLHNKLKLHPNRVMGGGVLFLILYQLISVFLGFELCDSGFYITFYDHILDHPECVEYNFMYYLTGIVGGVFMKIFPNAGLLEIRLLGLANNMIIIYLLYRMLRGVISLRAIAIGITLVVVSYIAMPLAFYNDLLTCLLYIVAIRSLLFGASRNSSGYIIIGGIVAGFNVFTRIPNVLGFGLILLLVLHQLYYRECIAVCLRRSLIFTLSFVFGIGVVVIFMKAVGHYEYFVANLHELTSIASSDSSASSHALSNMIYAQLNGYYLVAKFALKLMIPLLLILFLDKIITNRLIFGSLTFIVLIGTSYLFYRENPLLLISVFCIIGIVGNIVLAETNQVKMLSWAGALMMVIIPIGSDGGMFNNGSVIFWLAAPMAANFYMMMIKGPILGLGITVTRRVFLALLSVYILVCSVKMVVAGCYFDGGSILYKRYTIDSERVRGIYTTQQRAAVINDLLVGIAPYVRRGDCLLAYGSLPAVFYMTGTRPFAGCSWPELLNIDLLNKKLDHHGDSLPVVLRQKFNSIGAQAYQPTAGYLNNCGVDNGHFMSNQKQQTISRFVENHLYQVVFENEYFVLYLPPK